ncbi:hypothetical protein ABZX95_06160 [Streptomyces sp. NPDC004232]|uniref:hypothetical protein n=1 Tax=Streptomyces sp. NPDC004232 TaxID=3154454 RepID=UPI0033AB1EFA
MGKMARCDICGMAIRKADVAERVTLVLGALKRVTVHGDPENGCKRTPEYWLNSERTYLPVTAELEALIPLLEDYQKHASDGRAAERARQKQREDDVADYVCRLELETDRHGSKPCQAPSCPVTALFSFVPPSAYDAYRRRSGGCHRCNACGAVASEDRSGDECHSCRDWSGCGGDCTLVAVYCQACGTREAV